MLSLQLVPRGVLSIPWEKPLQVPGSGLDLGEPKDFAAIPGHGIRAV